MTPFEERRAAIQAKIDAALAGFVGQPITRETVGEMKTAVAKVLDAEAFMERLEIEVSPPDPRTGLINVTVLRMPGE